MCAGHLGKYRLIANKMLDTSAAVIGHAALLSPPDKQLPLADLLHRLRRTTHVPAGAWRQARACRRARSRHLRRPRSRSDRVTLTPWPAPPSCPQMLSMCTLWRKTIRASGSGAATDLDVSCTHGLACPLPCHARPVVGAWSACTWHQLRRRPAACWEPWLARTCPAVPCQARTAARRARCRRRPLTLQRHESTRLSPEHLDVVPAGSFLAFYK